jgi:putative peptidoglycan lipid II flippase
VSDVAVLSFFGRFLAFVGRTMYIGRFGAAHPLLNAFTFALQVPQVLFNIVNTALTTVMIPVYNALLAEEKQDEAKKFIDNVISIVLVLLGVSVVGGVIAAPWISRLVGGTAFEEAGYLVFALRVLMPAIIFFGFGAIFTGLLQSHGKFRLPALVSAPGGVIIICYVIFFSDRFGVTGLLLATLLGFFMQPLILLPAVKKLGYRFSFSFDLKNKNIRAAGCLCLPVFISVASYQIHFLFAHSMALRLGFAAVMDYAQQLVQVFALIIVLSVAAVYLPKLSALWAKKALGEYNENLKDAVLYTIFLVLPAACGMFLLRYEIMELLLNWRGRSDTYMAGNLMGLYAVGVVFTSIKEIADRGFYAMRDSKTPALYGVIIMLCNITVTLFLLPRLGIYAMPVAYGAAAATGVGGLLVRLYIKTRFITPRFVFDVSKTLLAAATMAAAVWVARHYLVTDNPLANVLLPATAGGLVYFAAAYMLKLTSRLKWNAS